MTEVQESSPFGVESSESEKQEEFAGRLLNQMAEIYVNPEIRRRQEAGTLPEGFSLQRFQVIMNLGQQPIVRLNEEIKGVVQFKVREPVKQGDLIYEKDLDDPREVVLTESDGDAGHVTAFVHKGNWHITFNFHYNTQKRKIILQKAEEFLAAAKTSLDSGHYASFHENLFAAMEYLVMATLTSMPDEKLFNVATHGTWKSKINEWNRLGNIDSNYVELYNQLFDSRKKVRYSHKEFKIDHAKAQAMLDVGARFASNVKGSLPRVYPEQSR
jgi:uncharacterized protein (UPF0332 family)